MTPGILAALRWLAVDQPYATSPDAGEFGEVRRLGWARDVAGRIELTDEGRRVLAEADSK
jgi:hypothetical protein